MGKRVEHDVEMFMHNCGCGGCKQVMSKATGHLKTAWWAGASAGILIVNVLVVAAYLLWEVCK